MRFLTAALSTMAFLGSVAADKIGTFTIDIGGDNSFQLYLSRASSPSTVSELSTALEFPNNAWVTGAAGSTKKQTTWESPSRYTGIDLYEDDVITVYVHNEVTNANQDISTNPSAIVARIHQNDGATQYVTDHSWRCIWRHEQKLLSTNPDTTDEFLNFGDANYNPNRLTGDTTWAAQNYDDTKTVPVKYLVSNQAGPTHWVDATEIAPLGTAIWNDNPASKVEEGLTLAEPLPFWIYGNDQHQQANDPSPVTKIAHHGWCRFKVPRKGNLPPGGNGDPVFSGFQGQEFQFHGLPDEHFNIISSPQVQLNAHFVYLSSGKCDYNNTACWTHPGTYMDVLGFSIGEARVKLVAGSHADGLRLWVNDEEVPRHTAIRSLSANVTASLHYSRNGNVKISTDLIDYEIINSDMFFNFNAALKSAELLTTGAKKHTVHDTTICHTNAETHNHQLIESTVAKKYHMTTPLHGLVGQTWRNVKVCGRDWMGTVEDYVTESLFGTTYHYNYFKF